MILKTQITLISFSILFGIYFSLFSNFNFRIIKNENIEKKFFFTFLFSLVNAMIYFLALRKINNGALHIYSFICIVISFILTDYIVNKKEK